jgi:MoaD family protein
MIREAIGATKIDLPLTDGSTISDAINQLSKLYPRIKGLILEETKLSEKYILLLNDKELTTNDALNNELFDGDVLTIIPPAGGG